MIIGFLMLGSVTIFAQEVSPEKFEELMSTGDPQIVDVRTEREYNGGHIANSVNIDYFSDDFQSTLSQLDKDRPVLIYCYSGGRSTEARLLLNKMGYLNVTELKGGLSEWRNAGKTVDK